MSHAARYWSTATKALPCDRGDFEGFDVRGWLREHFTDLPKPVLDFGCGWGRLADAFDPGDYVGVDVSPWRLERARREHPEHCFADEMPEHAGSVLAWFSLFHVPDGDLAGVLHALRSVASVLVVGEPMSAAARQVDEWRVGGEALCFFRPPAVYDDLLAPWLRTSTHDWTMPMHSDKPELAQLVAATWEA